MASAATHVAVSCRLPHGLILNHPMDINKKVELNGQNKIKIIGAQYATTMVEVDFWEQWIAVNKEFPAVKCGAIYAAKNAADVEAIAKEFSNRKTGFEALSPTAHGVKPAAKDE